MEMKTAGRPMEVDIGIADEDGNRELGLGRGTENESTGRENRSLDEGQ